MLPSLRRSIYTLYASTSTVQSSKSAYLGVLFRSRIEAHTHVSKYKVFEGNRKSRNVKTSKFVRHKTFQKTLRLFHTMFFNLMFVQLCVVFCHPFSFRFSLKLWKHVYLCIPHRPLLSLLNATPYFYIVITRPQIVEFIMGFITRLHATLLAVFFFYLNGIFKFSIKLLRRFGIFRTPCIYFCGTFCKNMYLECSFCSHVCDLYCAFTLLYFGHGTLQAKTFWAKGYLLLWETYSLYV